MAVAAFLYHFTEKKMAAFLKNKIKSLNFQFQMVLIIKTQL